MTVRIVTDSTASLPPEIVTQYDIRVVPLRITFGQETYKEGFELTPEAFYGKLAQSQALPFTSQPPMGEFQEVYRELTANNHEVISIHMTGRWTGTVDTARSAAASMPEARIHVVDSQFVAVGLELMIRKAAEAAARGKDSNFILERLNRMIAHTQMILTLDTLEYFKKGGRIGPVRALLGALLKVKPVLKFEDGIVVVAASVRTKHKAIVFIADLLSEQFGKRPVYLALAHSGVPDELEAFGQMLCERMECVETYTNIVGPVIGTHSGPGAVGAAVCPADIVGWDD